jgi:hypothetical protein
VLHQSETHGPEFCCNGELLIIGVQLKQESGCLFND